ncbi:unnamed protein product [Alopecurus aequalis]
MGSGDPWFASLVVLGAVYLGAAVLRLLAHLALLLRRPTDLRRRYGPWAVVTGPTAGIGRSVALELARRGLNIVLVGRNPAKLRDVSDTISGTHAVQTKTVIFDLALVGTSQACREGGAAAAEGDGGGVRRGCAREQRRRGLAPRGVPARGRRRSVGADGAGQPVGADGGDRRGAARDGGAGTGRRRQHRVRLCQGRPVVPAQLRLLRLQTVTIAIHIIDHNQEVGAADGGYLHHRSLETGAGRPRMYAHDKRYVDQFSRSLFVEYRSKGIDVQCQVPMLVDTKMTSGLAVCQGLLSRMMVVLTPDAYAGAAVCWIGHGPVCIPNLGHRIQYWCVCRVMSDRLLDAILLRVKLHQRALLQRQAWMNDDMSTRKKS